MSQSSQNDARNGSSAKQQEEENYRVVLGGRPKPPTSYSTSIHRVRIVAAIVIFLSLAMVVALGFAPIEDHYIARGKVRPVGYRYLYAPVDCVTSETLVDDDEMVTAGQPLMIFELRDMREKIAHQENVIEVQKAELERMKAQTSVKEALPLPKELWEISLQMERAEAAVEFHRVQVERYEKISREGAVSLRELDEARLKLQQARIELEILKKRMDVIDTTNYGQRIVAENHAMERVKQQEIRMHEVELEALKENYEKFRVLRAPSDGRILDRSNYRHGERNRAGQFLIYMSVGDKRMVEIAGDQRNFLQVHVGQKVRYASDLYDPLKHGYATGRVESISPIREEIDLGDARETEKRSYRIWATIDKEPVKLQLDSTVQCQIILRTDRLFKVLFGLDKLDKE